MPGDYSDVAVLVPCLNEEVAVAKVVSDFHAALPGAVVYVYDNGSTDKTVEQAQAAGAVVRREPLRGKGNVVRRMFADVEAEFYVLVDGDGTYDASAAPPLVERMRTEQLDMITGARVSDIVEAYRPGHRWGNALFTGIVARVFGDRVRDVLSGYRVFSRRFVKSFPAQSAGFEIETELTVHALELRMHIADAETRYRDRPPGSHSKLHTIRDGVRILRTIVLLLKEQRPLPFFGALFALLSTLAVVLAIPIVTTWQATGLVPRLPTAVLSTGLMLVAFLMLASGLILDSLSRARHELKRWHYLQAGEHRRRPIAVANDYKLSA